MSSHRKSQLFNQLKASGATLTSSYAKYTMEKMEHELEAMGIPIPPVEEVRVIEPEMLSAGPPPEVWRKEPEVRPADPNELPGQRLNTNTLDDVIRVDEQGRRWHQEEVRKPAYPKPRGRRVLTYLETGVRRETVKSGEYVESFEVAGNEVSRPAEVKITLPSYQVGIYTDPRFPFKIHCYDGRQGFDFNEVQTYFGGSELVPESCKRVYIENELCYDIRSVVRTIQEAHRQLQLTGRL